MKEEKIVLKGTTTYFEQTDLETSKRMKEGGLVFLNMPLPIKCNYKCLKCFSGGSDLYNEDLKKRDIYPNFNESLRKSLITEANNLGAKTLVIAGAGEPTLYPNLDNLLEYTGNLGMNSIVFTNGLDLSKERAKHLFDSGTSIVFSYDSTNPNTYDILTGTKGNHRKVRSNLENALSISKEYSKIKNGIKIVPMAVNTNLSKLTYNPEQTIDEIAEIHELVTGIATHFVSDITPTGNARDNWGMLVGTKDFSPNKFLQEAEQKYSKGSGGSGRKQDDNCAYIHNGIVVYEGYFMMCPNFGLKHDFGKYPDISISKHFNIKKEVLQNKGNPSCVTRK